MIVTRLQLKNWRNFIEVDVPLRERTYLLGANASGKSNLLDVFRFLRDISKPTGGGLQKAVHNRGDIKKLRCLHARQNPGCLSPRKRSGREIPLFTADPIPRIGKMRPASRKRCSNMEPAPEGSRVRAITDNEAAMLKEGFSVAEVLLPRTNPETVEELGLWQE